MKVQILKYTTLLIAATCVTSCQQHKFFKTKAFHSASSHANSGKAYVHSCQVVLKN